MQLTTARICRRHYNLIAKHIYKVRNQPALDEVVVLDHTPPGLIFEINGHIIRKIDAPYCPDNTDEILEIAGPEWHTYDHGGNTIISDFKIYKLTRAIHDYQNNLQKQGRMAKVQK